MHHKQFKTQKTFGGGALPARDREEGEGVRGDALGEAAPELGFKGEDWSTAHIPSLGWDQLFFYRGFLCLS